LVNFLCLFKFNFQIISGQDQTHLCISLQDKSLMTIPMKYKKSKKTLAANSTRSFLGFKANFIVSHPSGDFIFVAADNKIYTWEVCFLFLKF